MVATTWTRDASKKIFHTLIYTWHKLPYTKWQSQWNNYSGLGICQNQDNERYNKHL